MTIRTFTAGNADKIRTSTWIAIGERSHIANMANTASLIFHEWLATRGPDACNWVGFYLTHPQKNEELLLGPFMGKVRPKYSLRCFLLFYAQLICCCCCAHSEQPATVRIPFSRGVCGAAARSRQVQVGCGS